MGQLLIDLAAAALVLTALYARPTVILAILIGTVLLVPTTLVAPHLHTAYATVDRLVIAAAALRLAVMARSGALRRDHFRATPVHLALALLVAAWALAGVVFAPQSADPTIAGERILAFAAMIVFFIVTLALLRLIDQPMQVLRMLAGALVIASVIAVCERLTGNSFGHWLFSLAKNPGTTTAAHRLETRAGHVRVRASGEFALEFGWVCLMLLPVVMVVALRSRRLVRVGLPAVGLVLLAIYWTYARSAAGAIPAALVLLAIGARTRRTTVVAAAGVIASVALFLSDPAVRHHLSLSTDEASVGIRFQRLPPILEAVSHHPYLGLGLGGLRSIGVVTTDNFYLAAYSETGVIGAAILVAFCAIGVVQAVRGLKLADSMRRCVTAAAAVGFVAFLAGGVFYDALLLGQSAQIAMLLLAIAIATAEPELGVARMPSWSLPRIAVFTAAGALLGLAAFLIAPVVVSQERTFSTIGPTASAAGGPASGPALISTVCQLAHSVAPTLPDTHISCRDDFTAAGVGTIRVEAQSATQTLAAYTRLQRSAHQAFYLASYQTQTSGSPTASRATLWNTAPASGATLGFAIGLLAPVRLRRRRVVAVSAEPEIAIGLDELLFDEE